MCRDDGLGPWPVSHAVNGARSLGGEHYVGAHALSDTALVSRTVYKSGFP